MWKGIIGRSFSPLEFLEYVRSLDFSEWKPEFIVLHNTEDPSLAMLPWGIDQDQIEVWERYYRDEVSNGPDLPPGWSSGPHVFIDDLRIWVFTPLTTPGTHANFWNGYTLGVEMLGNYRREEFNSGRGLQVQGLAVAAVAILSSVLGLDPGAMMLHKENGATQHDCPGENVDKTAFINFVGGYIHDNNL